MLTEKFFDAGSLKINYAEGSANGAPLVLLHGITRRWQDLYPLPNELESAWHVFACDTRGHGKSGHAESYRAIDYFSDTKRFIQEQIASPTILLGHSAGAIVALGVAAEIPKMIRGVILLDPVFYLRELSIRSNYLYDYLTGAKDILTHQRETQDVFSKLFPDIDENEIQILDEMLGCVDQQAIETWLEDRYFEGLNLEIVLDHIKCPTFLLYAEVEKGGFVRESDVEFFLKHVPNGTAIQIKNAGHLLQVDQPARVLELIAEFTKQIHDDLS